MNRLAVGFFAAIAVLCPWALTCMAQSGDNSVAGIRALEDRLLAAEKAKDVDAMMKCYLPGDKLLVFDLAPPRQHVGFDAYKKDNVDFLSVIDGPFTEEDTDINVFGDGTLGYATFFTHYAGKYKHGNVFDFTIRTTDVLRKIDGAWLIVHEHNSFPVDLSTGKADMQSKP